MSGDAWTLGPSELALYRHGVLVGTLDNPEIAREVAATMNAVDRAFRCGNDNCGHPIMSAADGGWTHGAIVGWQGRRCPGALTVATVGGQR